MEEEKKKKIVQHFKEMLDLWVVTNALEPYSLTERQQHQKQDLNLGSSNQPDFSSGKSPQIPVCQEGKALAWRGKLGLYLYIR